MGFHSGMPTEAANRLRRTPRSKLYVCRVVRGIRGFDERFKEVVSRLWRGRTSARAHLEGISVVPLAHEAIGGVPSSQGRS